MTFTKRFLELGADDIEHADHDGSAPPNKVYEYYSMMALVADLEQRYPAPVDPHDLGPAPGTPGQGEPVPEHGL